MLKHLRLQPDVLDSMEFYRVEMLMDNFKEHTENENKSRKEQEDDQKSQYDVSSMQRQQSNMMKQYTSGNSLGNMGNFKMPNMPKF